jgi:threonine dehydrogenase-like Zn-dependent dehydrogenase
MPPSMRRVVGRRGRPGAWMERVPAPRPQAGHARVRTLRVGVDGTDEALVRQGSVEPPPGRQALTLGHEVLGRVEQAPPGSDLREGDRVVALVRAGCGSCEPCRAGFADLCPTGEYAEHGIKGLDGFLRDLWTAPPERLVRVPPDLEDVAVLTEPLSIIVKAAQHARAVQRRMPWHAGNGGLRGRRALVAGTGSLGSLATLLLLHEGLEVWAYDRHTHDAYGSRLLSRAGATHVNAKEQRIDAVARDAGDFDVIIETTGVPDVWTTIHPTLAGNGVLVLLGVSPRDRAVETPLARLLTRTVLRNQAMLGSVNSNRLHFEEALHLLRAFQRRWADLPHALITHVYDAEHYEPALTYDDPDVVKKVVDWTQPSAETAAPA